MACYNLPVHDIACLSSPDVVHLCREEDNWFQQEQRMIIGVTVYTLLQCES